MEQKICVVAGVGPGIGKASCELYAENGYTVIMLARNADYLNELAEEVPNTVGIAVDLTCESEVNTCFSDILKDYGKVDTLVYNAARGTFGNFLEQPTSELEKNLQINLFGLLNVARAICPSMIERGEGAFLITGNTAATRGGAKFAMFAPSKAAQRSLAQSMARELGPLGIHVAYVIIDAAVDAPWARSKAPDKDDDFFIQPAGIAKAIYYLNQQDKSCWTSEIDVRPFGEKW